MPRFKYSDRLIFITRGSSNKFLLNKNLPISISTDDPPFFFTTLSKEYEDLHNAFGWEIEIFNEINKRSLEFAFCDAKLKEKLIQQL